MNERSAPLGKFLLFWLVLYLSVGFELARTQGSPAMLDWTRIWALIGIATTPACFMLGWKVGTRAPLALAGLVALASVALAVVAIHVTVLRTSASDHATAMLPLSAALMLGGLAVFVAVFTVENLGLRLVVRLVVIVVSLALSVALIVPSFVRHQCGSQITACKSNLKNIGTGLEMYATDHEGAYPIELADLTPSYLKYIPTCVTAGRNTYSDLYTVSFEPHAYTFCCAGQVHGASAVGMNLPMYTSSSGLIEHAPRDATASPYLLSVRLSNEFLFVQGLLVIVGLFLLIDPTRYVLAIALLVFGMIPWTWVVSSFVAPVDTYNTCAHNLNRLRVGLQVHRARNPSAGVPPVSFLGTGDASPVCPKSGRMYEIATDVDGKVTITCPDNSHGDVGCPPRYPRFTERDGRVHRVP